MNATQAMSLPGGSQICRRHARRPDGAANLQLVSREPGRPASAPGRPASHPASHLGGPATSPLRLTRRGRLVAAAMTALLVTVLSLIAAGAAQAVNHSVPPRAAQQDVTQVLVRPGQSLWSVAESADPDADTRLVIQQIIELNALKGDTVFAGQRLWVPHG